MYSTRGRTLAEGDLQATKLSMLMGSGWRFDHASREGGRPAPAIGLLRVYFLGLNRGNGGTVVGVGINGLKCGVVAVMHCLRCSVFGLVRLLSQLNHAKTPNLYPHQQIHIKGTGAPIGRSSIGISTSPTNLVWHFVLTKRCITWMLGIFLITLLVVWKFYH